MFLKVVKSHMEYIARIVTEKGRYLCMSTKGYCLMNQYGTYTWHDTIEACLIDNIDEISSTGKVLAVIFPNCSRADRNSIETTLKNICGDCE